jgi:hypothetical protein
VTPHSFDTPKTVLIPAELYEKGDEEHYLRFNGMAPLPNEVVVTTRPHEGIVAVMAVPRDAWDTCQRRGGRATSPLLSVATEWGFGAHSREVNIHLTEKNMYLAVRDKNLRMAEVLPDNATDSILYFMQLVGRKFRLQRFTINVSGQYAEYIADILRQYYPHVKSVS